MSAGGPLKLIGGLVQAYGQVQAGEAAQRAYEFNANQAEQNAAQAQLIAAQDERQTRILGRKALGSMRAAYGASGVTLEGSPMDVLAESAAQAELDALNIKFSGETKATNLRNQAKILRYQGGQAKSAGYLSASATLLNAGGDLAGSIMGAG